MPLCFGPLTAGLGCSLMALSVLKCVCVCVQNEDFSEERIRFGVEALYIDCWVRRRIYDAFKEVLESGVRHHLQVR